MASWIRDRLATAGWRFVDDGTLATEPDDIAARKVRRRRHHTIVQVPLLRIAGFVILSCIVLLSGGTEAYVPWSHTVWLVAWFAIYCVGSWMLLAVTFDRGVDLGLLFLTIDPFVWMGAVYATGGASSWLFFLPVIRVADQVHSTRVRAGAFAVVGVAAYGCLLLLLRSIGKPIDGTQIWRFVALAGCGWYLAMTAGTAERQRTRVSEAVRSARESIRRLQEQTETLRNLHARAESANVAKSQFLANVSHEFGTPLNAIIGYAELLHDGMRSAPETVLRDLGRISRSAHHLRDLVDDLIELSVADAGQRRLDVGAIDGRSLVADVVAVVTPLVESNRSRLDVRGADSLNHMVNDVAKVRQILVNLVGNAGKFTNAGSVTLSCSREPTRSGDIVMFTITDTGIGMTEEQLERVRRFEPFVQGDASVTRRYGGTGLGLALSHRLSRLMDGSLTIDSRPGAGTTVTLRLPAVVVPASPPPDLSKLVA